MTQRPGPGARALALAFLLAAVACSNDATGPDARFPKAAAQGINADLLDRAYADARETP